VARLLFSLDLLGELRVTRSPTPGRRCPVSERVRWVTSVPDTDMDLDSR
jgi:hypothetical protein